MDQDTFYRLLGQQAAERLIKARTEHLSEHRPGPHSLEYVDTVKGVEYVNDSKSTFLDATLRSISTIEKPVVWIAGHLTADVLQGNVQEHLRDRVVGLVLFGKSEITDGLKPFIEHTYAAGELRTAVFVARELARAGEVVLFSPACPSGDGFANYEERGAEFKRAVRDL
jgi:UDP-N-acetylmuramoylalanine--D-glutamate ligase